MSNKAPNSFNPAVFYPAAAIIGALCLISALLPNQTEQIFSVVQSGIISYASWFYVLSVAIIIVTVGYLALSQYGGIKLGPDHSKPKYSRPTWFAMLFSAGMGIGLMFFGVAEPVMHYMAPPSAEPQTLAAMREAMHTTFFHWGLHAWAIYAIVALMLAFFAYRHNLPLSLRSALYPIIGDKIYGPIGHAVDVFAVIGTVFGVATSLGIGASQVNSGLNYLYELPVSTNVQIGLIVGITLLAVVSVATGLEKGIRRLSELNMIMAVLLLFLILALGPSIFLMEAYVQNIGGYLTGLVRNTFNLFAYDKTDWIGGWTIFYWGWWLAWAPFVGLFIARISRGRTIREFIVGVLLIPTGFTLFWMTVFGNSAIDMIANQAMGHIGEAVQQDTSSALFVFLEQFPFVSVLSFIAVLMIVVFFVTSADSGSLVVDMLCSDGSDNTPVWQRVFWASMVGLVAIALMLAGGLSALQTMTIASALPFTLLLLTGMLGLLRALRIDAFKRDSLTANIVSSAPYVTKQDWRKRLETVIDFPSQRRVRQHLKMVVLPAMQQVQDEMETKGLGVVLEAEQDLVRFSVEHNDETDFVYSVYCGKHVSPSLSDEQETHYFRAEVHLREGGQDYDIMGWSELEVINDIIEQYQKHLHFLHMLN